MSRPGGQVLVRDLDGGLAGLGAYGINFHDNDVFDFAASPAERDAKIAALRTALDETGLVVTTATTNLALEHLYGIR